MRWIGGLSLGIAVLAGALVAAGEAPPASKPPDPAAIEFFERKVRPVLVERCFKCHASSLKAPMGGLALDSRAALLKGGASGPALTPGNPEESPLLRAIRYTDPHLQMPPSGRLPAAEIAALSEWVRMGAPFPGKAEGGGRKVEGPKAEPPTPKAQRPTPKAHWAFQPARSPALPKVKDPAWCRTPIDRFILGKLEARGLRPGPAADRRALIRRVTFDLTGLPPTPEEVEAFVRESSSSSNASQSRSGERAAVRVGVDAVPTVPAGMSRHGGQSQPAASLPLGRQGTAGRVGTASTPTESAHYAAGLRVRVRRPSSSRTPNAERRTPNAQPPTPNADPAYERLVDRLLASPHYGERWARHWLDLVRYAETRGHEMDAPIPNAWQYRDYVIRALNQDVPYDRFVTEHLAGDLLKTPRLHPDEGYNESVLGTGFWFLGEEVHSPVDIRQDETDRLDNRLDVFGKTFVGLTVGCARCHDHKFDPISQRDYYGLAGFLLSSSYRQVRFQTLEQDRRLAAELDALEREAGPALLKALARAERAGVERSGDYLLAALEQLSALKTAGTVVAAGRERLDPTRVARWTEELRAAASDPMHPLHPIGAGGPRLPEPSRAAQPEQVVVDYSQDRPGAWLADGFVFGTGPVISGTVRLGNRPEAPIAGIADRAAAEQRPAWSGLRLKEGTEVEPGALGGWGRAGRTLRTPTVTLRSGVLRYLTRGSGKAYASVDSHTLVAGPLHGRVLREWTGAASDWQWITHDLRPYRGHRVHVEFTPASPEGHLAVARVIESEADPGPAELPNRLVLEAVRESRGSPAALAAACGSLLRRVNGAMGEGRPGGPEGDMAGLADWLVRNPDLFLGPGESDQLAAAARPFLERHGALLARARRDSATAPAMIDGTGVDECLLNRGSHRTPGETVPRRFLQVLDAVRKPVTGPGSGRLELARRLLAHPLTARVMVNRVWQHHFGEGLVRTPDDFGTRGERPTHSELLDYLASRFTQSPDHSITQSPPGLGWSLKRLHRVIVLSAAYRMSSRSSAAGDRLDPQNRLLHRTPVRRLEAEAIRDAILSVSGGLDRKPFGPPVTPYLTEFTEGRGRPASSGPLDGEGRRSIYLGVRRNFLTPWFLAFDYPVPFTTIGKRSVSSVPAQALALMNNPFVTQQAGLWARRLLSGPHRTDSERLTEAYTAAFARPPTATETTAALEFLRRQRPAYGADGELRAWSDLCHVLINTKEFLFVD